MENIVFKYEPIRIEAVGEEGFRADPPLPKFETFRRKQVCIRKVKHDPLSLYIL